VEKLTGVHPNSTHAGEHVHLPQELDFRIWILWIDLQELDFRIWILNLVRFSKDFLTN
jgi:hypothetical protein